MSATIDMGAPLSFWPMKKEQARDRKEGGRGSGHLSFAKSDSLLMQDGPRQVSIAGCHKLSLLITGKFQGILQTTICLSVIATGKMP